MMEVPVNTVTTIAVCPEAIAQAAASLPENADTCQLINAVNEVTQGQFVAASVCNVCCTLKDKLIELVKSEQVYPTVGSLCRNWCSFQEQVFGVAQVDFCDPCVGGLINEGDVSEVESLRYSTCNTTLAHQRVADYKWQQVAPLVAAAPYVIGGLALGVGVVWAGYKVSQWCFKR